MRIIGGEARGRTLVAPKGQNTRPTQDYVRESLFNILRPRIEDAAVLDLFAGTGALALESVSRGARLAVMVDSSREALTCIRKNVEAVRCGECRVIAADYREALSRLAGQKEVFDLIFLDPPYRMENTGEICESIRDRGLLAEDGLIVVEHRKGTPPAAEGFRVRDHRTYGDTEVTMLEVEEEA